MIGRLIRAAWWIDRRGVGAVEFAIVAPLLILLYIGGYQLMDAIAVYRKVTVTTRALADLTSTEEKITPDNAKTLINGARQVMTPYSTNTAKLFVAQIKINNQSQPQFTWVCSNVSADACAANSSGLKISDINIPPEFKIKGVYIVFGRVQFEYNPIVMPSLLGSVSFGDQIFMLPRKSSSVCLNTGTSDKPQCLDQGQS